MRFATTALLALSLTLPAGAGTLADVTLPDKAEVGGQSLVLNGMGLRKEYAFVKVYVGALYLPQKEKVAAKVMSEDVPRRMVMHFLYSVTKDQMCGAWKEGLERNTPNAPADVKKAFSQLCVWMEPIPKGNELVLTYVPGKGTEVQVNGKAKGTVEGKAASDAILATWIGKDPAPGADFKKAVLGG
jgi:hypothetical protein